MLEKMTEKHVAEKNPAEAEIDWNDYKSLTKEEYYAISDSEKYRRSSRYYFKIPENAALYIGISANRIIAFEEIGPTSHYFGLK